MVLIFRFASSSSSSKKRKTLLMFSSLFSGLSGGLSRALDDGLQTRSALLDQRQRLIDTAHHDRTHRRLATRTARLKRKRLEQEDQRAIGHLQAKAAGSGLHLAAGSKTAALMGETATRAARTAQATSVLSAALADRLSRAALRRQRQAFTGR